MGKALSQRVNELKSLVNVFIIIDVLVKEDCFKNHRRLKHHLFRHQVKPKAISPLERHYAEYGTILPERYHKESRNLSERFWRNDTGQLIRHILVAAGGSHLPEQVVEMGLKIRTRFGFLHLDLPQGAAGLELGE